MPSRPSHNQRLQQVVSQNEPALLRRLHQKQIKKNNIRLFLQAFKTEAQLEVWVKNVTDAHWRFFKPYPFCRSSGTLGPKRKEGDGQIPEGIYHIDRFNPNSKYHLSLGLNYPNLSDRILGDPSAPGSDIFIHGGCETVGCIPITDEGIEELYVLASWAKANGQTEIPVHIFPFRFAPQAWEKHLKIFPQRQPFWEQLALIYRVFERTKVLPAVQIDANGEYVF